MEYRVLTVSREFGSGGGRIAQSIATRLGWKLLDGALIEEIAGEAKVDPGIVSRFDEHVEGWLARVNRQAMRGAAMAAGVALKEEKCFDPDAMADLARKIIEHAYEIGDCVIVGRGAQCILQAKADVFHAFVYAPRRIRIHRLRTRLEPGANFEQRLQKVDDERALYLKQRFGKDWKNPHLYDLMISSGNDEEMTAHVIEFAMAGGKTAGS
ncbi:AAA family ATPase [Occallatibacter savannae]|uniref:cytidylate kinase-like family protein n=1 Tax=Occallatibacter savannae TaxID=1002691 RepID=UPI0013A536A5|nr:cytidylate kinase-like family protein [Occallatibacter savannae]